MKAAGDKSSRQGAPSPTIASLWQGSGRLLGKHGSFLLLVGIYCTPTGDLKTFSSRYTDLRRILGAHTDSSPNTWSRRTWRRAGASTVWVRSTPLLDSQVLIHCPGSQTHHNTSLFKLALAQSLETNSRLYICVITLVNMSNLNALSVTWTLEMGPLMKPLIMSCGYHWCLQSISAQL